MAGDLFKAALGYPCPKCNVKPGESCQGVKTMHHARYRALYRSICREPEVKDNSVTILRTRAGT